jgi:integrase
VAGLRVGVPQHARPADGAPLAALRRLPPALKRAGLPPITFHALRHTAATLLLAEGEHPKVVQELLGHAQVSTTLSRDSHMTPRLMSNAAALLDGEGPGSQAPDRF